MATNAQISLNQVIADAHKLLDELHEEAISHGLYDVILTSGEPPMVATEYRQRHYTVEQLFEMDIAYPTGPDTWELM